MFNTFDNHLKFAIVNLTGNNVDSLYIKTERDETDLFYKTIYTQNNSLISQVLLHEN